MWQGPRILMSGLSSSLKQGIAKEEHLSDHETCKDHLVW
ncbi:hypothetical protein DAI22_11g221150 [Oryza sativa Japonica Group]|nr:hypothetical protein DAI22_11g221150 [Oryza sativa Japonica Group]